MSPMPGASSHYPGVIFDVRAVLLTRVGTGTTGAVIRRLRRLATRMEDEQWLELTEAVKSLVELGTAAGKSRADLDAQLRDFLQRLGSDDDGPPESG